MSETKGTVLVELQGGLGNQMFQVAAGLALARRTQARLVVNASRFRERGKRSYALAELPVGRMVEVLHEAPATGTDRLRTKLSKLAGGSGIRLPAGFTGKVYRERGLAYEPDFEKLAPDVMLVGYFQSPLYFDAAAADVVAAFDATAVVSEAARARAASDLDVGETVAVHLRRGDYVSEAGANRTHGVLDDAFYERAVALLRGIHPQARFRIFSDEPAVAEEKAGAWRGEAVRGETDIDDMWLMSRCRHHIIANSSFSWWSAWLDRRPGAMVVAPRRWFTREKLMTTYVGDLFPEGWVLL